MELSLTGGFCFAEAPGMKWSEVGYGLDRGLISARGVVEYASDSLSLDSSDAHYDLAGLDGNDSNDVKDLMARLMMPDSSEDRMKGLWIYLTLLWLYRNRDGYENIFVAAECLYADFDYPECMSSIIRYMPPEQPGSGGESQLLENWDLLLERLRRDLFAESDSSEG